jgi:transcriptional regulator with XRE-family HTH domain
LLRTWRTEVAGVSLNQLAKTLSLAPSALSQWETGRRRTRRSIPLSDLARLDEAYAAGGALVDIALAVGTPHGLPARRTWAHNVQGPSGPVWAWLRLPPGIAWISARLLWGAFRLDCTRAIDERGLFITSPVSMTNPAAWVHLGDPGWVDFGHGTVPDGLGIPVIDALSSAELGNGGHSVAGLVAPNVIERFETDPAWAEEVLDLLGDRRDLVIQVFRETPVTERITDLSHETPASPSGAVGAFTGGQYRTLRLARGLSQAEVADLATELMPKDPVTDDQIGLLERGGTPRSRFLRPRLDCVYRADGHTCLERVKVGGVRSPFAPEIPEFWIGPIWFTLTAAAEDGVGDARIQCGEHRKRMRVRSGTTVTCRRPTPEPVPFTVYCPSGWTMVAGIGAHPHAQDVNWGWLRDDDGDRQHAPVNDVFLGWFGRTAEDFEQLYNRSR